MCILKICIRVYLRFFRVCDVFGFNNVFKGIKILFFNNLKEKKKYDI